MNRIRIEYNGSVYISNPILETTKEEFEKTLYEDIIDGGSSLNIESWNTNISFPSEIIKNSIVTFGQIIEMDDLGRFTESEYPKKIEDDKVYTYM